MNRKEGAFWAFVKLRQDAYWRRANGRPPPYSNDEALASYHFCNVYREADRGTIYFQQNRKPVDGLEGLIFQAAAYRLINRVSTFVQFGGLPTLSSGAAFAAFVDEGRKEEATMFTGRHLNIGYEGFAEAMAWLLDGGAAVLAQGVREAATLEAACKSLLIAPEIGNFFAWQLTCDLMESGVNLPDDDWALLGTGGKAGAVLVNPETGTAATLATARALRDCQPTNGSLIPPPQAPDPFSLKNVEHALCEYARYVRAHQWIADGGRRPGKLEDKPWKRQ